MPHLSPRHRTIRRTASLCVALVLPLVVADGVAAQATGAPPAIRAGAIVRLRVEPAPGEAAMGAERGAGASLTGELLRLDADSVVVRTSGGPVAAPRARVREIAVNTGRRPLGSAVWRGAVIGAGIGALVGAADALASYEPCGPGDFLCPSRGGATAIGGIAGAIAGSLVGGVIGGVARRDRWAKVALAPDLRIGAFAAPRGLGVTIGF